MKVRHMNETAAFLVPGVLEILTVMHACGSLMSYSPVWVPSTRQSIRATRQHREAVTVAKDNCVIYVITGNG
jgi:hypothetical protein